MNCILPRPIQYLMSEEHTNQAREAAAEREAWHTKHPTVNREGYQFGANNNILVSSLIGNLAACIVELAASVFFCRKWNTPYWKNYEHKTASFLLPDVGDNLEVKWSRRTWPKWVYINPWEAERNYYLLYVWTDKDRTNDKRAVVRLLGFAGAADAWLAGEDWQGKRRCNPIILRDLAFIAEVLK